MFSCKTSSLSAGLSKKKRIKWQHCASKMLSFSGCLQLVSSVIFSIQIYVYDVFVLPAKVMKATKKPADSSWSWRKVLVGTLDACKLGGKSFWRLKKPTDCTWSWSKILKTREDFGNGVSIRSYYWHPRGPLAKKYGVNILKKSGIPFLQYGLSKHSRDSYSRNAFLQTK